MPRRTRYPFVQRNPGGRLYLRKPGFPRVRLPGPYGGPEFLIAYYAALAGEPVEIGASRTIPRSMNALIVAYYGSAEFKSFRPSTARVYRRLLERFREEHGGKDAAGMKASNVRKVMNDRAATPDAANHLLSLLSALMELAIALGWRDDNPTVGIKRIKCRGAGFATWSESDIAIYRNYYPLGTRERLGAIAIKQSKTGAAVTVPIVRELHAALDLCPRDRLTFIAQADGRPLDAASLGNDFRCTGLGRRRRGAWPRQAAPRMKSRLSPATQDAFGGREIHPGGREDAARCVRHGEGRRDAWP
jgi:hypothetical protein